MDINKTFLSYLKSNHRTYSRYLLYAFAFSIPFAIKINSILLICLTFISFFIKPIKESLRQLWLSGLYLLPVGFYLLCCLSVLYSNNLSEAFRHLELKASFILLPFIFSAYELDRREAVKILITFSLACLIVITASYIENIIYYIKSDKLFELNENGDRVFLFYYYRLLELFDLHPTYFSMYLVFVLAFLILSREKLLNEKKGIIKAIYYTAILVIIVVVLMLTSRAGIASMVIILSLLLVENLFRHFTIQKFFFNGLLISIFVVLILNLSYTKTRIEVMINSFTSGYNQNEIHSANKRLGIWTASIEVIKKSPLIGHGIGERHKLLDKEYEVLGYNKERYFGYNAHSQWLQLLINLGIIGFLYFGFVLCYPLFKAKSFDFSFYLLFALLIAINFVSESILARQKGVIFFVFFYCLLVNNILSQRADKPKNELIP